MNALDFVLVAAMIAAGYFGYRLGFVARVVSWAGLAVGIVLAVAFVDDVTGLLSSQGAKRRGMRRASRFAAAFRHARGSTTAIASAGRSSGCSACSSRCGCSRRR